MNIKKRIPKFLSLLLCFSMTFGNMIPAYATENTNSDSMTVIDGENISTEERNLEDITVTYKQASSFFVTIPKTIVLDGWKQSTYSVKVSGDIDAEQCVYVAPVDMIDTTENIDFLMKDQATENAKDDVVANVTHKKSHWNATEVAAGHKQADNLVEAPDLTAGAWRGIFQMEIKLETHVTHKHNYKDGTCTICGGKCTHNFVDGRCTICGHIHNYVDGKCVCGTIDPNHTHNYKDGICTICGGKCTHNFVNGTCTICGHIHNYVDGKCECGAVDPSHIHNFVDGRCTICGHIHNYIDDKCICGAVNPGHIHNFVDGKCTICGHIHNYADGKCECGEIDPNHTHNYEDGTCTICGKETDPYEIAPANAYIDWDYTLDNANNVITLNYYKGSWANVIVYANYVIGGKTYKTQLASNINNGKYMFDAYKQYSCEKIVTIKFSKNIDTSNVTNMMNMFNNCKSLISLDLSSFDTNNVTNMCGMFKNCSSLISLDVSNFDTSKVTNMNQMFYSCKSLANLDVSSFDTSKVTGTLEMFRGCSSLSNLDVSGFDTSNMINMSHMFHSCTSLTSLDVRRFNTSNVTNMSYMFSSCTSLTSLDVSNFDTSKVTNMDRMFCGCSSLVSLDVSSFDTSKVTNMRELFYYCSNLKTIYATRGKWSTSKASSTQIKNDNPDAMGYVIGTYQMFTNCGTSTVTYK